MIHCNFEIPKDFAEIKKPVQNESLCEFMRFFFQNKLKIEFHRVHTSL